jgi:uncharacterized integral membrane protein (TIGR00697 family)
MNNSEKIYIILCILFSSLIMLGNLIYQKFVSLHFPFHIFELSVGAILYPLTFLITDLITEFYGKERAQFCIRIAMCVNILVILILTLMDSLPSTSWSKINDETFHNIFGYYGIAFIASITACYVAQAIDVRIYLLIKKLTKDKYLWLRSNGSTCISLFIDTSIVIGFLTLFEILPRDRIVTLIINSYSWKLFFTICSTPLFYAGVLSIKYYFDLKPLKSL